MSEQDKKQNKNTTPDNDVEKILEEESQEDIDSEELRACGE